MKVIQIFLDNSLRNFNYILYSEITKHAIVFDPYDAGRIESECENHGILPRYLLNTHHHPDHIRDNKKISKLAGLEVLSLEHQEVLQLSQSEKIICLHTPGHVDDHFCYFLYEDDVMTGVISGDTVFNAGVGNCKNGGDPHILYQTIRDIFVPLNDDVLIYPSHDYFLSNLNFAKTVDPSNIEIDKMIQSVALDREQGKYNLTSIKQEKMYNPFFRAFDKKFLETYNVNNKKNIGQQDFFLELRAKRDCW